MSQSIKRSPDASEGEESPMDTDEEEPIDLDYSLGKPYKQSLFKLTTKRTEQVGKFVDTYYITYKFDVHGEEDDDNFAAKLRTKFRKVVSEAVRFYRQGIPENLINDGGIVLIVLIHWEVLRNLGSYDQGFFLSRRKQDLENALRDTLWTIVFALGMMASETNQWITTQLVSNVAYTYQNSKLDRSDNPSIWVPVIVEIAVERGREDKLGTQHSYNHFLWGIRDSKRFLMIPEIVRVTRNDAKESCSICLEDFEVECALVRMPSCSHVYHFNCIIKWLAQKKKTCPLCRGLVPKHKWRLSTKLLFLE